MDINIVELKNSEYENVEKYAREIYIRLREIDELSFARIISTAYASYIVRENKLQSADELLAYIDQELPESQRYFLRDRTSESYWDYVIELSKVFASEQLLAVVLWYSSGLYSKYEAELDTPESIVKLAHKILKPQNEDVADICSGVGSFLVHTALNSENKSLYGVEINTQAKEISEIRLSLITNNSNVEQKSALTIDTKKKFDKIFCNYPWAVKSIGLFGDNEQHRVFEDQIPELKKNITADWYFILNVANHLKDDGKAVVLTTNGTTWNGGPNKIIRERFIKLGLLEAVIALPANLFTSTSIPTSMLIISKNNFDSVRMIDATELATVGRRQSSLDDAAIKKISEMLDIDSDSSKSVTFTDIDEMDYAINPSRYLQTEIKVENGVPFKDLINNITRGAQVKAADLDKMVSDVPTPYQYLMLANIQDGLISDALPYIKELDKKLEKYCVKNNSLIISKNGTPVKVAIAEVEEDHQILANGNLYTVEIDENKANPYFIKAYLESEEGAIALSRISVGAVLPNIPVDSLKKMLIPNPPIEEQNRVAEKYHTKADEIKVLRYRLQKATAELKNIFVEG